MQHAFYVSNILIFLNALCTCVWLKTFCQGCTCVKEASLKFMRKLSILMFYNLAFFLFYYHWGEKIIRAVAKAAVIAYRMPMINSKHINLVLLRFQTFCTWIKICKTSEKNHVKVNRVKKDLRKCAFLMIYFNISSLCLTFVWLEFQGTRIISYLNPIKNLTINNRSLRSKEWLFISFGIL